MSFIVNESLFLLDPQGCKEVQTKNHSKSREINKINYNFFVFQTVGLREKTEEKVGNELFESFKPAIYWLTIVSGSVAAITTREAGVRIGCLAHLYLAGRRHIMHQNNSAKYWVCECSTTMPNHHTSSRIITSTVHHTSANNFIKAHLNKSTVTAQCWVFKWSWHVLDSSHYHGWPWWVPDVSEPKKVTTCLPDIHTHTHTLQTGEETATTALWTKQATCLITVAPSIYYHTML